MTAAMMAAAGVAIVTGTEFDMTAGNDGGDLSGFNDGPGPDYGTNSPANFLGIFVVAFRYEDDAPENFKVALLGTGRAQTIFTRVTVTGPNWDVDFLTADADRFDDTEQAVQTSWEWDLANAVFTNSSSYVVTLYE